MQSKQNGYVTREVPHRRQQPPVDVFMKPCLLVVSRSTAAVYLLAGTFPNTIRSFLFGAFPPRSPVRYTLQMVILAFPWKKSWTLESEPLKSWLRLRQHSNCAECDPGTLCTNSVFVNGATPTSKSTAIFYLLEQDFP